MYVETTEQQTHMPCRVSYQILYGRRSYSVTIFYPWIWPCIYTF